MYGFYINQKAMIDLRELTGIKLDHGHAAIVQFVKDFAGTGELETIFINNQVYYWISHQKVCDEMPLYDWEKNTIYKKMLQLVEAKIFYKYYDEKKQRSYYGFAENYIYIVKPIPVPKRGGSENNPRGVGLESEGGSENNPTDYKTITSSYKKTQPEKNETQKSISEWKPNPAYHTMVMMQCCDMDKNDFETELIKFRLHYQEAGWPKSPDKVWLSWCQRTNLDYRQLKSRAKRIDDSDELARQRMTEFHEKKQANIGQIGSNKLKETIFQQNVKDHNDQKKGPEKEMCYPLEFTSADEFQKFIDTKSKQNIQCIWVERDYNDACLIWKVSPTKSTLDKINIKQI